MRRILTYITVLLSAFAAFGLQPADSAKVYFRVGQSRLDPSFADNREALDAFESELRKAIAADVLDSLVIKGFASPEGQSDANMRLSENRCNSLKDYILNTTGISDRLISTYPGGIAWEDLRTLVAADASMPYRAEVLDILDNVPVWVHGIGGKIIDGRKKRLMDLAGGVPYRWMQANIFPEMRNAVAIAVYLNTQDDDSYGGEVIVEKTVSRSDSTDCTVSSLTERQTQQPSSEEALEEVEGVTMEEQVAMMPVKSRKGEKCFLMAVKTNMLYDAALVPNLGAEFYLGGNTSLYGEWMYAWWDKDRRHRYWRVYGGNMGFRWWFGRKAKERRLSGHHIGVYGGILTFDFELGDYGYMGGKPNGTLWDRHLVNAGIEYGFSLPVAKRLNIDFSIGIGYLGGKYIKYYPFDNDYYFDKEYNMHFFGPTKAEVSLVWLIGNGRSKIRKGGDL